LSLRHLQDLPISRQVFYFLLLQKRCFPRVTDPLSDQERSVGFRNHDPAYSLGLKESSGIYWLTAGRSQRVDAECGPTLAPLGNLRIRRLLNFFSPYKWCCML